MIIGSIYIDASKYVSERVSHMKELFQYWYKKAFWFRPCVLILDNLDKLLPAEVEVREFISMCSVKRDLSTCVLIVSLYIY